MKKLKRLFSKPQPKVVVNSTPYVKKYDENGELTNPITKESPYYVRRLGRNRVGHRPRPYNNSGRPSQVISRVSLTKFMRFLVVKDGARPHLVLQNPR